MPEDIIQLLKETGLASEEVHGDNDTSAHYDYGSSFLNPQNTRGTLLSLFRIQHKANGKLLLSLQLINNNQRENLTYLRALAGQDNALEAILLDSRDLEETASIDYHTPAFSDFVHALIAHFDKTRYAHCAYQRALKAVDEYYPADQEKRGDVKELLRKIRNTAIDLNGLRTTNRLGQLEHSNFVTYQQRLSSLATEIKTLDKITRSHKNHAKLWDALRLFLLVVKKIIPTKLMKKIYNRAFTKTNDYDYLANKTTHAAHSLRLFQQNIGAKAMQAEIKDLIKTKQAERV